jgi:hypothetical protein
MRDAAIQAFVARHRAADLAWLNQIQNASSSDTQDNKRILSIQALDAIFAEYGR